MFIRAIKTKVFIPPKDDLLSVIKESFSKIQLKEKSIFIITSKVVSIWQGRCVTREEFPDKDQLIVKEADFYLDRKEIPNEYVMLTIKNNVLLPTAGIDESNAKGYYILLPQDPYKTAKQIYDFIQKEFNLKELGVIITDSRCTPLRRGTTGVALSYYGFNPLRDYRKTPDLFGRNYKVSVLNIADSLAVAGVLAMGEGSEQTPIAIVEDIDNVKFGNFKLEGNDSFDMNPDFDIYAPLLKGMKWKKGEGGLKNN
ncbi:MAG: coenzyme F420-0:L-glutamate ligase [Patescibacteria group bacterium]